MENKGYIYAFASPSRRGIYLLSLYDDCENGAVKVFSTLVTDPERKFNETYEILKKFKTPFTENVFELDYKILKNVFILLNEQEFYKRKACECCGETFNKLLKCDGCKGTSVKRYCGVDCQRNDWINHKEECWSKRTESVD
jgi:hypothetical protein